MSAAQRKSALSHRKALDAGEGVAALKEKPFEGKLILRGRREAIGAAVSRVLGAPLPAAVLETEKSERASLQWLGPDEWLIVTPPGTEGAIKTELDSALRGIHSQVVDVTDYYTTIELSGTRAREMLMKIATVDFHPRSFKLGMGVTTNLGRSTPWLRQVRDDGEPGGPAFDIVIRISMADYLWCLLAESGHEWGLPELDPKGRVKLHLPHFETHG